ncbi:MAG: GAF domain-containing protein [Candidatus Magasanikbacteria bacterium]|nr:GAF domain-containing protein [Candidatus Magasanikbacteria bacterium]
MFLFSYSAAIFAVICLVMAILIFLKKHDRLSLLLATHVIGVSLWNVANAFADLSWSEFTVRLWCGMALIGSMIFIVFYIIFLEQFLTSRIFKNYFTIFFILFPALFFSVIAFSGIYITEIDITGVTPAITVPGKVNYLILAYSLGVIVYGLSRLRNIYHSLSFIKQRQILYIKIGFLVNLSAGIIFTIILPLLGNFMLFSLAAQFTMVSVFLTIYVIYRHRFLDIKIVVQRGLIFSVLSGLIVLVYLIFLFLVQSIFFRSDQTVYLISAVAVCLMGIFFVPKIDSFLRRVTNRVFFKDRYNATEVLGLLSEALNSSLNLSDLILKTSGLLEHNLKIKKVYINLLSVDREKSKEELKNKSENYMSVLVIPLARDQRLVGAMFLDGKLSGDDYTSEDLALLNTFAHQMTLALEKSQLYEEVKDYSKNLEIKIAERIAEIKNLQERQSQELFEIAHELQTPLTVLKGELSVLITSSKEKEKVQILEKNIDRISRFITSLLRLARLDFAEECNIEKVNLSQLLNSLVEEFLVIAQESNIVFKSNIRDNIFIKGDKNKLVELVSNLVSNAMKYISNERVVVVSLCSVGKQASLKIIDTGVGIPLDDFPNLFQKFYRGHRLMGSGTGLGLAICKKIITLHGGQVSIKSQLSKGTIVEVFLPLVEENYFV